MFDSITKWLNEHVLQLIGIITVIVAVVVVLNLVDVVRKPPEIEIVKGSIQQHLVWSVDGQCFFVKPYSNDTVYLISVPDCNKK